MAAINEYSYTSKMLHGHVRNTLLLGLCPIFISATLLLNRDDQLQHILWFILLFTTGLELILLGGYKLIHEESAHLLKTMQASPDRWFPWTVFTIQNLFILLNGGLFWVTIIVLGFPAQTWQHLLLGITTLIIPVRRSLSFTRERFRHSMMDETLHLLMIVLSTLFLAGTLTNSFQPPGEPTVPGSALPLMVIWIVAILVIFGCFVLFLDRMQRTRKKTPPSS